MLSRNYDDAVSGNSGDPFNLFSNSSVSSSSYENLKRARSTLSIDNVTTTAYTGNPRKDSQMKHVGKSEGYSFFPPKRRTRHERVVSEGLPEIPIVAAPPVVETNESFSWGDFPQSSHHYTQASDTSNQQISNEITRNHQVS